MSKKQDSSVLLENRKARYLYFLSDFITAGLVLTGTEIKSLRKRNASLSDSYIFFKDDEAYIANFHIASYKEGNIFNVDHLRDRKLLLHKREIKKYEAKVKEIRQYTEYAFVSEDLNIETLREIGIQNCDVVIVCIGEKVDVSILTTMRVLELGVPNVIAKALSPEQGAVLKKLGAEVVYPERDMALRLGKKLISSNFLDYVSLFNSVEIRQIQIPDKLIGCCVEDTEIRRRYHLNIIAIESGNETSIEISPTYQFRQGDIIVVIGKIDNIDAFENTL